MFKKFSLLRSLLAVLIIFIPLYPKFPLTSVTGTYVAIRLDDLVIATVLGVWFFYQLRHRFPIFREPVTKLIIAYFIAITLSFVAAFLIFQTDPPSILLLHLIRRFEYVSLIFLTISTIKDRSDLFPYYIFFCLATIGTLIYGYGQKYLHFPVISTMNSEFSKGQLLQLDVWSRLSSTFAGHYDLAVYLSVALIIIGGIMATQKNIYYKIFNLVLWGFAYHMLTLTASRVSFVAVFLGMSFTLVLLRRYLWIIPLTVVFIISLVNSKDLNQRLLATVPALKSQFFPAKATPTPVPIVTPTGPIAIVPTTKPPVIVKPVPTVFRHGPIEEPIPADVDAGVARSGEIRFNAEWPRAITAFRKNIFTGTGLGSITLATDNDYLRSLGESGLIGFFTFMAIFLYFAIKTSPGIFTRKFKSNYNLSLIFFGCLVTFLINATLIDAFEASKTAYMFWIMMGVYYQAIHFNHG